MSTENFSINFDAEGSKEGQKRAEEIGSNRVLFIYCKMEDVIVYLDAIGNNSRKSG